MRRPLLLIGLAAAVAVAQEPQAGPGALMPQTLDWLRTVQSRAVLKDADGNVAVSGAVSASAVIAGAASTASQLLAIGDSLTVGWNGTSNTPYTGYLTLPDQPTVVNLGVSGQSCNQVIGQIGSYLARYANLAQRNTAVVWCGTNDLAGGSTVPQAFQNFSAICKALKLAGFQVIGVTMISRTGGYDVQKNQFNQILRERWESFMDGLVDLGANASIGIDGKYADGTKFAADGVHVLQSVYSGTIAPAVSLAYNSVVNGRVTRLPFLGSNIVANGGFASSASWSTIGSGWSISGGVASMSGASGSQLLYQAAGSTGNWYAVTYTLTAVTAGTMHIGLGGTSQQGNGIYRSAPGTYTDILYADASFNGNLVIDGHGTFIGSIDDVSMQIISASNVPGVVCQTASGFSYRAASACQ